MFLLKSKDEGAFIVIWYARGVHKLEVSTDAPSTLTSLRCHPLGDGRGESIELVKKAKADGFTEVNGRKEIPDHLLSLVEGEKQKASRIIGSNVTVEASSFKADYANVFIRAGKSLAEKLPELNITYQTHGSVTVFKQEQEGECLQVLGSGEAAPEGFEGTDFHSENNGSFLTFRTGNTLFGLFLRLAFIASSHAAVDFKVDDRFNESLKLSKFTDPDYDLFVWRPLLDGIMSRAEELELEGHWERVQKGIVASTAPSLFGI